GGVVSGLRQRARAQVDLGTRGGVLSSLNGLFPRERHGEMYFTIWYGVSRPAARTLTYSSAGHHPAYLVPPDRRAAHPLGMKSPMIGAGVAAACPVREAIIPAATTLYLFTDGWFEIVTDDGRARLVAAFGPRMLTRHR